MTSIPAPGKELLREVRSGFIRKGTTLGEWCRDNGKHLSNARQTLLGSWDGNAGRRLRQQIIQAAGLKGRAA